jgi:hypothetical protein
LHPVLSISRSPSRTACASAVVTSITPPQFPFDKLQWIDLMNLVWYTQLTPSSSLYSQPHWYLFQLPGRGFHPTLLRHSTSISSSFSTISYHCFDR